MCCSSLYSQIVHLIKASRNGEAADQMTRQGIVYNMNYGVSLYTIKKHATDIGKDHTVAQQLWRENIRETKLFALYLFDASRFTKDDFHRIILSLENTEMAEQAAFTVLGDGEISQNTIMGWCQNELQLVKLAAYNTIIRKLKIGKLPEFDFGLFFEMLEQEIAKDSTLPIKSISFALSEIARKGNKTLVEEFLKKIERINTKQCQNIVSITKYELEYIN